MIETLESCYKQAESKQDFLVQMQKNNAKPYERNGVLTGVWYGNRKYRLRRLGFDNDRLKHLDKRFERHKDLQLARFRNAPAITRNNSV